MDSYEFRSIVRQVLREELPHLVVRYPDCVCGRGPLSKGSRCQACEIEAQQQAGMAWEAKHHGVGKD